MSLSCLTLLKQGLDWECLIALEKSYFYVSNLACLFSIMCLNVYFYRNLTESCTLECHGSFGIDLELLEVKLNT